MPRLNVRLSQSFGILLQQTAGRPRLARAPQMRRPATRLLHPAPSTSSRESSNTSFSQRLPRLCLLLPSSVLAFICTLETQKLQLDRLPFCLSSTRTTTLTLNTFQTEFQKASSTVCHSCRISK